MVARIGQPIELFGDAVLAIRPCWPSAGAAAVASHGGHDERFERRVA